MIPTSKTELRTGYVSIIVRFHNPLHLEPLDLALFSLANQGYERTEVLICCQSFTEHELDSVRLITQQTAAPDEFEFKVLNKQFGPGDHRSDLLNMGIEAATGQYLGFLDYDDVVYEGSYKYLVQQLQSNIYALAAFGGINIATIDRLGLRYYCQNKYKFLREGHKLEFFSRNLYPIHSGIIDRYRIDNSLIKFDSGAIRNEDYIFFMRILSTGTWCDRRNFFDVGEYMQRVDGSNTVMSGTLHDEDKQIEWRRAYEWLMGERNRLTARIRVSDLAEFLEKSTCLAYTNSTSGAVNEYIQLAGRLLHSKSWRYTRIIRQAGSLIYRRKYTDPTMPSNVNEAVRLIAEITLSTSWAISGPLRIIGKIFSKFKFRS